MFESHAKIIPGIDPLTPFGSKSIVGGYNGGKVGTFVARSREIDIVPILQREEVEFVFALGLAGAAQRMLQRGDIIVPTASIRGDKSTDYWALSRR